MTACIVEILADGVGGCNMGVALVVALSGLTVDTYQVATVEEDVATSADIVNGTLEVRVLEVELSVVRIRVVGILT